MFDLISTDLQKLYYSGNPGALTVPLGITHQKTLANSIIYQGLIIYVKGLFQ
jgi:hypothetical protein